MNSSTISLVTTTTPALPADLSQTIDHLEAAVAQTRQADNATALIDALLTLGKLYFDAGNTPKG